MSLAKFETGLKTLGPFISGQCSSVARIKGFRYLYDRAQEVSQYTRPFVLAILPILYKQHWRIASIDTRRNYFVALLDPQLVTERVELQRPLTTMLSLFREITRLLHLDTAEPPGSRVTPNTNFKLARGQLENIYLGLQTDRWSCGFWCFTLMIFLMRQPNVPPSEIKRHLTAVATNIPAAFYHWMKSKRREAALNSLVHKLCSSPGAT